ncbi:MAG: pilus assembly protein [Anaerolineae bacterium]|nr:pilus assembly protein [Anaerolineae bacterium]
MKKNNRGQGLVEFALIIPILLTVFFAIIDTAFVVQGYLAVNHAAREAARFAVTYQPVQGQCYDHNGNGNPNDDAWPWCNPVDPGSIVTESETAYNTRRIEMIKLTARDAALGLRIYNECYSATCSDEPGLFQVRVWGFPDFDQPEEEDHPGLQGLPVRVQVVHRVPLVVFSTILPRTSVRVRAATEMINEGVQVGFGNQPPPTFNPSTGSGDVVGVATVTPPPGGGGGTAEPTPTLFDERLFIKLDFELAINQLPEERQHIFAAQVTDSRNKPVPNVLVTFRTNNGSFHSSGIGPVIDAVSTNTDGWASTSLYANRPVTATIQAWLDTNSNGAIDTGEPQDIATKIWQANGPYVTVSDYEPEPGSWLAGNLIDHYQANNPYSLWWCPQAITSTQNTLRLGYPLNVESDGNLEDIPFQVPANSTGLYRLESHKGDGGADACGDVATLEGYSADIKIKTIPPDLRITGLQLLTPEDERASGYPLTFTLTIENAGPTKVQGGPFDLDLYVGLDEAPEPYQLGTAKLWIAEALEPAATTEISIVREINAFGTNQVWAQVDTSNYIDEGELGGEDNNITGPLEFELDCGIPNPDRSDDFNSGIKGVWQGIDIGSGVYGSTSVNGSGQLEVRSRGSSLWSGANNTYYFYQSYNGDFDARLRIIDEPTTNQWGKIGLHTRETLETKSPYIAHLATHYRSPAAEQMSYRDYWDGNADRISGSNNYTRNLPYWARLVRKDNTYYYYYSEVAEPTLDDWVYVNSHTSPASMDYIGIVNASYNSSSYGTGTVDDFRICTNEGGSSTDPRDIKPPGLRECTELINISGFEGNADTVGMYWKGSDILRTSAQFYRGSFSMRMYASLGVYPCSQSVLDPYLHQNVQMPLDIHNQSTLIVSAQYMSKVADPNELECNNGTTPDPDDQLFVRLRKDDGTDITSSQLIGTGEGINGTWNTVAITLSDSINIQDYKGQNLQLYWDATHDEDYDGTYFYLDEVSAQVCTEWAIPEPEAGTASFGGQVKIRDNNGIPQPVDYVLITAYTQGSEIYTTRSFSSGTDKGIYRFYNIPPGRYDIVAEAEMGDGTTRIATFTGLVFASDERRYDIHLLFP